MCDSFYGNTGNGKKTTSKRGGIMPDDSHSNSHWKWQKESESTSSAASLNPTGLDKEKIISTNMPEVTHAFA